MRWNRTLVVKTIKVWFSNCFNFLKSNHQCMIISSRFPLNHTVFISCSKGLSWHQLLLSSSLPDRQIPHPLFLTSFVLRSLGHCKQCDTRFPTLRGVRWLLHRDGRHGDRQHGDGCYRDAILQLLWRVVLRLGDGSHHLASSRLVHLTTGLEQSTDRVLLPRQHCIAHTPDWHHNLRAM